MVGYMRPVPFRGMSSWANHRRRTPPSAEAGVDYYCAINTPVHAAGAGVVYAVSDSIAEATGRFITIDLDDGRRVRYLHLLRREVGRGDRVGRGQIIGYSGASGYGEQDWSWNPETGGAHVHFTMWPSQRYVFGPTGTIDPEPFMDETPVLPELANAITRKTPQTEDTVLIITTTSPSKDGLILEDRTYADDLTGPVALLSAAEVGALEWNFNVRGIPFRIASWPGDELRGVVSSRGLRPHDPNTGRSDYAGKIIY